MTGEQRTKEERWARSLSRPLSDRLYQPQFPAGWERPRGPQPDNGGAGDALTGHYRCSGEAKAEKAPEP